MAHTVKSYLIPGPHTSAMNKAQAEEGLKRHPALANLAQDGTVDYEINDIDGRWVASIAVVSEFPPSDDSDSGSSDGSPSDGPSDGPPSDDSPDDDSDSSDGPPDEDGPPKDDEGDKKEKGGDKKELTEIHQMLQTLCLALGVALPGGPDDSPVPGDDQAPPPPGGPEGGPAGPSEASPDTKAQHPMHPGDVPPGGTPLGSPAFSSVQGLRADHPWAHIAGKVASFQVNEPIGDSPMDEVQSELRSLAAEAGFKVKQAREFRGDDGERRLAATVSIY